MDTLGAAAWQHRDELEEVKLRLGITHTRFDCWIFLFLENKKYNVEETIAKLIRRDEMERNDLATYEVTDYMHDMMRLGIMSILGEDRDGRVAFYIVTRRDFPKAKYREERKRNFDMWMSYGSRLRASDERGRIVLLINQKDAGIWANSDMSFQTSIAIRISKFYPGVVDRAYVCSMSRGLAAVAGPILRSLPKVISSKIFIYGEKEVDNGKMLEFFEDHVLPIALGGSNDCDNEAAHLHFAETVTEHFTQLKAGLHRGLSVKEWELEVLHMEEREAAAAEQEREQVLMKQSFAGAASFMGAASPLRSPRHVQSPRHLDLLMPSANPFGDDDDASLGGSMVTCDDETNDSHESHRLLHSHPAYGGVYALYELEKQEAFFRESFLRMHGHHRAQLSTKFLYGAGGEEETATSGLARSCPSSTRHVTRGVLLGVCVLITVFFFAATIFLQLAGAAMMVVIYIGMFVGPINFYPCGLGLLLLGHQCGLVGTRGFELVRGSLKGQLYRPLQRFGRRGHVAQFVLYAFILIMQFLFFVFTASVDEPVAGLRTALGVGMFSCAVILGVFHLGFPLGLTHDKVERERGGNKGGLYLFLNISEDRTPDVDSVGVAPVLLTGVPATLAVLFGLAFVATARLSFGVVTIVATMSAGFAVSTIVQGDHTNLSGNVIRVTTWLTVIFWLFATFSVGLVGWGAPWSDVVVGGGLVTLAFLLITACCVTLTPHRTPHRVAFRVAYAMIGVMIVAGITVTFFVHWAFGVFSFIMLLHSVGSYARLSSVGMIGMLTSSLMSLLVLLTLILYAFQAADYWADTGVAAQLRTDTVPLDPTLMRYPVCLQRWGVAASKRGALPAAGGAALTTSDLALLTRLSYFISAARVAGGLALVFPAYVLERSYFVGEGRSVVLRVFRNNATRETVAVLVPSDDRMAVVSGMSMWSEAIALSPYALVLPRNWTAGIVGGVAFVGTFFPLPHMTLLQELRVILQALRQDATRPSVVIAGHSFGGGVASIVGAQLGIRTVTFAAPGMIFSRFKFDVTQYSYLQYVTSVVATNSALTSLDWHGETVQRLSCSEGVVACSRIDHYFCELAATCGTVMNRTLSSCGRARRSSD
jgi:hypothetical protein